LHEPEYSHYPQYSNTLGYCIEVSLRTAIEIQEVPLVTPWPRAEEELGNLGRDSMVLALVECAMSKEACLPEGVVSINFKPHALLFDGSPG
jgi:hypothetical protein